MLKFFHKLIEFFSKTISLVLFSFFFMASLSSAEAPEYPVIYRDNNGHYGYSDMDGHLIIQPQFEDAQPFSNGAAAVRKDGKWGYIDTQGGWIVQPEFDIALPYKNGNAIAYNKISRIGIGEPPHYSSWIVFPSLDLSITFRKARVDLYCFDSEGKIVIKESVAYYDPLWYGTRWCIKPDDVNQSK